MIASPLGIIRDEKYGVYVYNNPMWLPKIHKYKLFSNLLDRLNYSQALRHLRGSGCEKIVLSLWRCVDYATLPKKLYSVLSYHVTDEFSFSSVDTDTSLAERRLLQEASLVFFISIRLLEKKGHLNKESYYLPNGVDTSLFSDEKAPPADMRKIPRPILGYVGNIKAQLDFDLLYKIAYRHREWSFLLVGPVLQNLRQEDQKSWKEFVRLGNVYHLGRRDYEQIPGYIKNLDVGLLPYKINSYTSFINPLKLKEYLAAGVPVVSTKIDGVAEFSDIIRTCMTYADWELGITAAVGEKFRLGRRLMTRAREFEWDVLVEQMCRRWLEAQS